MSTQSLLNNLKNKMYNKGVNNIEVIERKELTEDMLKDIYGGTNHGFSMGFSSSHYQGPGFGFRKTFSGQQSQK